MLKTKLKQSINFHKNLFIQKKGLYICIVK